MFKTRSTRLERIDTGDYTEVEYARFLHEIRFINRYLGDGRALRRSLLREIETLGLDKFSVLDVGCGSGELLRSIAAFARRSQRPSCELVGLDLNEISVRTARSNAAEFPELSVVRGNAFTLPFADRSFDYAIASLFFHHLTDKQIPDALSELSRVARRAVFVIDLHRHPAAYILYKLFCFGFRISPLVTQDGSLSILRSFKPNELGIYGSVKRSSPFRLVLRIPADLRTEK